VATQKKQSLIISMIYLLLEPIYLSIIGSLSKFESKFSVPCWLTGNTLWDRHSLDNSVSQKFHEDEASPLRVRYKSILFSDIKSFLYQSMVNHFSL